MTGDTTPPTTRLPSAALDRLRARVRGAVLSPDDDGYDDARTVWNARVDRYPGVVLRCAGVADVVAGVDVAREYDLPLAVKGGGHHVSGSAVCDDGVVLDLGPMDGVRVDPDARTARVGAGATWGVVDHETQAFDLAVPGGQDPDIGVAGLTLGVGVGWLSRVYGLTCDNLLSADVVTAAGEWVHASESEHADLFWALRGGGGALGVVTSFEFRLHEVHEVFAGSLVYPAEETRAVARRYRRFVADAPREVRLLFGSMVLPDSTVYPESVRGTRVAILIACYAGSPAEGCRVLDPLRAAGDPVMDSLRPRSYASFQRAGASGGSARTHLRSQYVETLTDPVVDAIAEFIADAPSEGATVFVSPRGGAETDPAPDATAYPHREDAHHLLVETRWNDPDRDDDHVAWVRAFHEALRPHTTGAVPLNFLPDDEPEARVRTAYGENRDRLAAVKREWDPGNLFRTERSVDPAGEDAAAGDE
ncbi:FAD-binding oxidoreductase [Halomarina ordinaria]|uniref:FAD-binding oxidoreductase n=1 Tax=Halomarina ordinaria TaxID=3033939 RepID=A0ABD5UFF0_9EURY|nr:FAD-binding oxidoreductase [Halomarina sp. PSRA2]